MACKNYDITISPLDIASATGNSNAFLNGRVFVNYPGCYGTSPTISYNTAGSYNNAVCADNEDAFNFSYYRFETSLPATNSFETEDGNCCTNIGTGFNNTVLSTVIQPDGKIIAGGTFTQYNGTAENYAVRLTPNGSKDTSFNIGVGFNNWVRTVYYQTDDKIVIGGDFTTFTGTSQNRLIRLNTDGSKDTSFNIGSGFNINTFGVLSVAQYGTSLYVGGGFTTYDSNTQNRLIRLNSNGSKDTSFNIGTGFDDSGAFITSICVQSDNQVLVGGSYTSFNGTTQRGLIRLNPNGSKDTSFNIGTGFSTSTIVSRSINSIVQQTDDKLLVGGFFTQYSGIPQNYLIRLNPNGTKDTSFDIGSGFNGTVRSVVIQPDGKILVGGDFTTYKGLTQRRLIRLDEFGEKDTSFDIGIGFGPLSSTQVYSINLQNDGSLIVTGAFTSYNGNPVNRIVKLSPLGTFISDCIETTPTPTPTQTKTPTPTPTNTQTPTPTQTQTKTPTQTQTPTNTVTSSQTPSTTPISCGLGLIKTNSEYYYTDCCGNFISGFNNTGNELEVSFKYNLPRGGVGKLNVPASVLCLTPTPTPTQTVTPTNTATPTVTPTNTITPTQSVTPSVTPSNTPVTRLQNSCDVITLFDLGVSCNVIQSPTESNPLGGILSVNVTGGTSPYSFSWVGTNQRSQTLNGVPAGTYQVIVTDYAWPDGQPDGVSDYTATTICELVGPVPTSTPTMTPTPTQTTPVQCVDLCLIAIGDRGVPNFGPIQFVCDGTQNGRFRWTSYELDIVWNPINNRWEIYIAGTTPPTPFTVGGGIVASTTFDLIPDSAWAIFGGDLSYTLTMTRGNCPTVIPLQVNVDPTNSSCQGTTNCNGEILILAENGYPPYLYSIDGGITYSNDYTFTNLCPNTYSVVVRDSFNNTQNSSVSVGFDSSPVTYQLSLTNVGTATPITVPNVSQTITQVMELVVTPPLPVGVSVTFNLKSSAERTINSPGVANSTINWTVTKNGQSVNTVISPTTISSQGTRPFCSVNDTQLINLTEYSSLITITNGDVVNITSTTVDTITNGQVSSQTNCTTNIKTSVNAAILTPKIVGNNCSSVVGSSRQVQTNELTYVPVTITNPCANCVSQDITIGTQIWSKCNLDVTTYSDGTPIPQVTDPTAWVGLTTGAWCYYENNSVTGATYGKLYNWFAVAGIWNEASKTDVNQRKKLAPNGYHIPSDDEWTVLTDYLGGELVAGGKMKEPEFCHWNEPNTDATNITNFSGFAGGGRGTDGVFGGNRDLGIWWSSTEAALNAYYRFMTTNSDDCLRSFRFKNSGYSVRLIKDPLECDFNIGSGFSDIVQKIVIQPTDNKILVGGTFNSYKGNNTNDKLIRIDECGTIDTTFNNGNVGFNNFTTYSPFDMKIIDGGSILVAGQFTMYNNTTTNYFLKLNSNGTLDTTFNSGGSGFEFWTKTILVQPLDGKIIVSGNFLSYNGVSSKSIIRLNPNGSIDNTFIVGTGFNSPFDRGPVDGAVLQDDGRIVLVGRFTSYNGTPCNNIIRLNPNGTVDNSFVIGTGFVPGVQGGPASIIIDNYGKLLIGGLFTSYNGVPCNNIIRLEPNGSVDTSFSVGSGFDAFVSDFNILDDDSIIVVGRFRNYNSISANNIIKLTNNGSVDNSFVSGIGFNYNGGTNSQAFTVTTSSTGEIFTGGFFNGYNSTTLNYRNFVKLNPGGTSDTTT